jgi:hypothetical protein
VPFEGETVKFQILLSAALLFGIDAAPAAGEIVIPLSRFNSIELNGGGTVILRYGQEQRVRLVRGSLKEIDIRVSKGEQIRLGGNAIVANRDQLIIDACRKGKCGETAPVVEVYTPSMSAVSVKNGGRLEARGAFPLQANVGAAVSSGGTMDLRAMPFSNVGASVSGGGSLLVRAETSLGASVQGGGDIRFWGNPSVGYSISGGGTILPGK